MIQGFVPETGFVPWTSLGWPRASVICLFSLPTQSEPAAMRPGMIGGERPCVSGKPENASRHPFGPTHPQTH